MGLPQTVFELIDLRSFSNLWFWIALAVIWSSASHWVLGVPWDMVMRARRKGGQAETDFEDMVRINVNRLLYIAEVSGLMLMSFVCFVLTTLLVTGFWYGVEFAQALFLLGCPLSVVGVLSLWSAHGIRTSGAAGEDLRRRMWRHRMMVQMVGVVAIFVTAMWGMFQNMSIGVLGG
ncbi:component of SufBCD complex [Pseudooceanicola sp. 216_PA32_1]|uniref:Component of SufBCD complex n=1 Tax=Pseudooceanicola pacificus TaxID=2676438 RepID=A0A844WCE9_9RHOB|nr:component of SufBCD complex [Pseudooceanicola pacificus]MWB77200.1 component of SufBCD complex [Pseudooceanicola pacificus]